LIDFGLLQLFIPTFFIVSLTPGMCMTLAMSLGIAIGVRQTLWMMWGELLGVAIVAISSVLGVSALMLQWPIFFLVFKFLGASYLLYIGINMWRSKGKLAVSTATVLVKSRQQLFKQGLITALANPKGWAFMLSLLPPFINQQYALMPQLTLLVLIILLSEFFCMLLYATGGKTIGRLLIQQQNVKRLNQLSGSLMILVAVWLALS
jgi:threonine/homoserine/homoserine lactone efflux protein